MTGGNNKEYIVREKERFEHPFILLSHYVC